MALEWEPRAFWPQLEGVVWKNALMSFRNKKQLMRDAIQPVMLLVVLALIRAALPAGRVVQVGTVDVSEVLDRVLPAAISLAVSQQLRAQVLQLAIERESGIRALLAACGLRFDADAAGWVVVSLVKGLVSAAVLTLTATVGPAALFPGADGGLLYLWFLSVSVANACFAVVLEVLLQRLPPDQSGKFSSIVFLALAAPAYAAVAGGLRGTAAGQTLAIIAALLPPGSLGLGVGIVVEGARDGSMIGWDRVWESDATEVGIPFGLVVVFPWVFVAVFGIGLWIHEGGFFVGRKEAAEGEEGESARLVAVEPKSSSSSPDSPESGSASLHERFHDKDGRPLCVSEREEKDETAREGFRAVHVDDVCVKYGDKTAVEDVSLRLGHGRILCLLGVNGAGKSSLLRSVTGLQKPSSGRVWADSTTNVKLGVCLQEDVLLEQLRPAEVVALFGCVRGMRWSAGLEEGVSILTKLGLDRGSLRQKCIKLSGGQKRRVSTATALVGSPQTVILDEPSAGVDPQSRRVMWSVVQETAKAGAAVLLTTHVMEEAEALADVVAVMHRGRVRIRGTINFLRTTLGAGYVLRTDTLQEDDEESEKDLEVLEGWTKTAEGLELRVALADVATVPDVIENVPDKYPVVVEPVGLDSLFFKLLETLNFTPQKTPNSSPQEDEPVHLEEDWHPNQFQGDAEPPQSPSFFVVSGAVFLRMWQGLRRDRQGAWLRVLLPAFALAVSGVARVILRPIFLGVDGDTKECGSRVWTGAGSAWTTWLTTSFLFAASVTTLPVLAGVTVVEERFTGRWTLQRLLGVPPMAYRMGLAAFEWSAGALVSIVALIVLAVAGRDGGDTSGFLGAAWFIFFLHGLVAPLQGAVLAKPFDIPHTTQAVIRLGLHMAQVALLAATVAVRSSLGPLQEPADSNIDTTGADALEFIAVLLVPQLGIILGIARLGVVGMYSEAKDCGAGPPPAPLAFAAQADGAFAWEAGGQVMLALVLSGLANAGLLYVFDLRRADSVDAVKGGDHLEHNDAEEARGVIEVEHLRKMYENDKGVRDVSFSIPTNTALALIGANGAGKTTTLRCLTAQEQPDSGVAQIAPVAPNNVLVGFVPQFDSLWPTLSVKETLEFFATIRGSSNPSEAASQAAVSVGLEPSQFVLPIKKLSGGQRRRTSLAAAFVGGPGVARALIIDEASTGLDPEGRRRIWRLLRSLRKGRAVLFTTHHLEEAERLGDDVVIMLNGRIRAHGSPLSLRASFAQGSLLEATLEHPEPLPDQYQDQLKAFLQDLADQANPSTSEDQSDDNPPDPLVRDVLTLEAPRSPEGNPRVRLTARILSPATLPKLFRTLLEKSAQPPEPWALIDWTLRTSTLEQAFLALAAAEES